MRFALFSVPASWAFQGFPTIPLLAVTTPEEMDMMMRTMTMTMKKTKTMGLMRMMRMMRTMGMMRMMRATVMDTTYKWGEQDRLRVT